MHLLRGEGERGGEGREGVGEGRIGVLKPSIDMRAVSYFFLSHGDQEHA